MSRVMVSTICLDWTLILLLELEVCGFLLVTKTCLLTLLTLIVWWTLEQVSSNAAFTYARLPTRHVKTIIHKHSWCKLLRYKWIEALAYGSPNWLLFRYCISAIVGGAEIKLLSIFDKDYSEQKHIELKVKRAMPSPPYLHSCSC